MGIKHRPYVGSWDLNQKEVIKHTPDCLVYINGYLEVPGCQSCNGRIDLQKFITSVSVDPSTQPPSSAQISMVVPRHYGDDLFRDGQFILTPGLEVHIYMRGYFPVKGMLDGVDLPDDVDLSGAVMYPYYLVHHGVVTEVSHEYSGGEYTASMSCSDLLHFWQYQKIATSGSIFGARPSNSKVKTTLVGSIFNGMNPYAIIYNLWKDSFGAAGGVEFALGNRTNAAANSTALNESMWSMVIRYWEQRFSESMMSLRMYGADGSLYNAFEQAFLATIDTDDAQALAKHDFAAMSEKRMADFEGSRLYKAARAINFDVTSLRLASTSESNAKGDNLGLNVTQIQAFIHDIGSWGSINEFETTYEAKMDIANQVAQMTGFEFYMDVDGDLVFKPPFYNLDVSNVPAYVIRPVDVISISFQESEPEVTHLKATGDVFTNLMGTGLSGEWGLRAEYIDYRLVAKYGWRSDTFESQYFGDPRALFYAAVNRMDLFNIGVRSASLSIPLRPELRPGYPIYIQHLDMFGYVQSLSHSFTFGGECTTNLNLVGLRTKFLPPGDPPGDGGPVKVENIRLQDTTKPKLALQTFDESGHPRLVGVPNVVLGIDPEMLNPLFYVVGADLADLSTEEGIRALIKAARMMTPPILTLADDPEGESKSNEERWLEGPFVLFAGQGDQEVLIPSPGELARSVQTIREAQNNPHGELSVDDKELTAAKESASALYALIAALGGPVWSDIPDGRPTWNYLDALNDLKATFNPGASFPGYYRYFSSSIDDEDAQGMKRIVADERDVNTVVVDRPYELETPVTVRGLVDGERGVEWGDVTCRYGLPIVQVGGDVVPTPTHHVQTLSFAAHEYVKLVDQVVVEDGGLGGFDEVGFSETLKKLFYNAPHGSATSAWGYTFDTLYRELSGLGWTPFVSWGSARLGDADPDETTVTGFMVTRGYDPEDDPLTPLDSIWGEAIDFMVDGLVGGAATGYRNDIKEILETFGVDQGEALDAENLEAFQDSVSSVDSKKATFLGVIENLLGESLSGSVQSGFGVRYVTRKVPVTKTFYTPVFPVSDAKGYEVIGSYRYGRGLDPSPGGTWEELSTNEGATWDSIQEVEEYLWALTDLDIPPGGTVSAEQAAQLAAEMGFAQEMVLTHDGEKKTLFEVQYANWIGDQATDRVFKLSITNVAYSLADMGLTSREGVCECKGAQADLFLQAFVDINDDNVLVVGPEQSDDVSQWVSNQMVNASASWSANQSALRGDFEPGSSNLFEGEEDV